MILKAVLHAGLSGTFAMLWLHFRKCSEEDTQLYIPYHSTSFVPCADGALIWNGMYTFYG